MILEMALVLLLAHESVCQQATVFKFRSPFYETLFSDKIVFGQKSFRTKKFSAKKVFGQKKFWPKKFSVKKNWTKTFSVKKVSGQKIFDKKVFGQYSFRTNVISKFVSALTSNHQHDQILRFNDSKSH
jgi:hypothetical protein